MPFYLNVSHSFVLVCNTSYYARQTQLCLVKHQQLHVSDF